MDGAGHRGPEHAADRLEGDAELLECGGIGVTDRKGHEQFVAASLLGDFAGTQPGEDRIAAIADDGGVDGL